MVPTWYDITEETFVASLSFANVKPCTKSNNTQCVCYSITNDDIEIVVTYAEEDKTCRKNNAAHLLQAIEDALLDMRTLLE